MEVQLNDDDDTQELTKQGNNNNANNLNEKLYDEAMKSLLENSIIHQKPIELFPKVVQDSTGEEIQITYSKSSNVPTGNERQSWGGKLEFICTCISMAVGLGNVWRFPYLCYKNGGGAFLIPYFVMLFLVGLPIFNMELAFGQFASRGPITVWSISPLFKGVGYGMVITSLILSTYYNIIISQCFYYLVASFGALNPYSHCNNVKRTKTPSQGTSGNSSVLYRPEATSNCTANWKIMPWSLCDPSLNSTTSPCTDSLIRTTIGNITATGPSEQYYERTVLNISDSIDDLGVPQWKLVLCLLVVWIIVIAVLLKGVNSLGKVAVFTAVFPFVMLTILLIRGATLPGAWKGVIFYIRPRFHKLLEPKVWTDAATQIFFSLSCCNGNLITMSSYNNFKNNCVRDAVYVALINCMTSIFAGFVIFTNLGFMADQKNVTVDKVVAGGPGLAFMVYPESLAQMDGAPIWSILFFMMMLTLGFGSQFAIVETVLAGIQDELRRKNFLNKKWQIALYRVSICFGCFLVGLIMTCRGGMYVLTLLDYVISGYVLLVLAFSEIIVICYVYGINRFNEDIRLMTKSKPNWYWRIMWLYITPAVIIFLIIFYFISGDNLSYGPYVYPPFYSKLSHLVAMIPLISIPGVFLYQYCRSGGWILLREVIKPKSYWGPADEDNRQEFISSVMRMDENNTTNCNHTGKLHLGSHNYPHVCGGSVCIPLHHHKPQNTSGLPPNSSGSPPRTASGDNITTSAGAIEPFFQSKRSLASKFSEAALKELNKTNS